MGRTSILLLAMTMSTSVRAGSSNGFAWNEDAIPVTMVWSGAPEGLTHDEVATAITASRTQWVDRSCSAFDFAFVEGEPSSDSNDGQNSLVFGDPRDEVNPEYPAITKLLSTGRRVTWNGVEYLEYADTDIVFSDSRTWMTDAAIEAGGCTDAMSFQAVLTRYLGYVAGLGSACERDEECSDPALQDATMYWEIEPCDTRASTVEMDDAWTLATVYGTPVRVACTRDPADDKAVACELTEPADAPVTWDFGDGGNSNEASTTHVYSDGTERFVRACVTVEECGQAYCYDLRVPGTEPTDTAVAQPAAGVCGCSASKDGTAGASLLVLAGVLRRRRESTPSGA